MEPPPDLLTIQQVARRLNCSPQTVRRLVEKGRLAPGRSLTGDGKTVRWAAADVVRFVEDLRLGRFDQKS